MFILERGSAYQKLQELKPKLLEIKIENKNLICDLNYNLQRHINFMRDFRQVKNGWDLVQLFLKWGYTFHKRCSIHIDDFNRFFLEYNYSYEIVEEEDYESHKQTYKDFYAVADIERLLVETFEDKEKGFFYAVMHKEPIKIKGENKFFSIKKVFKKIKKTF